MENEISTIHATHRRASYGILWPPARFQGILTKFVAADFVT